MSQLAIRLLISEDRKAFGLTRRRAVIGLLTASPFWLVVSHRLAATLVRRRLPLLPGLLHAVGIAVWGADISPSAVIGPGFRISHTVGIVVGEKVRAGRNLWLFHGVTLGGRDSVRMPVLGDCVTVYSGAVVMGDIVVGSRTRIGANAVVFTDLPGCVTAVGNPAVVRHTGHGDRD